MFIVNYNSSNANDILRHAKQIEGLTLRHYLEQIKQDYHINSQHKGRLGNLVEEILFGYKQNSNQEADFKEVEMELKVTPLKYVKNKLETKERLVLSMINYKNIVNETWDSNSILKKLSFLLLMFYIHEKDKDVLDLIFLWKSAQNLTYSNPT